MIELQDIQIKLTKIKEQIMQNVSHPYLLKYIQAPTVDEDKLLLLVSLMEHLNISNDEMESYVLTTMLIQIALDTHEHVTENKNKEDTYHSLKNRQLTVLAGDYYSGLYYKHLSEINSIGVIRTLAAGIKDVNEHKISVYQKDSDGIDKLMNSIKMIESSLFEKLTEYFQADVWDEYASNLLFLKRLINEKKKFLHAEASILFEGLKKLVFPKNDQYLSELSNEQQRFLLLICDRYIEFAKHLIEKGIKKLPFLNELLKERTLFILNQHHTLAKTFVEEG
ncbi:heptaprenyl diphosphate synthase component I [Bacillus methanolicus PB1]|uniref:Heptaprenyl diphosphate synthase component I n=1 Tax=Bacillus methanolicus PB1 TaxID=997296 RepID=I3DWR4_BACMT|nr:heptaprenyl diphosphate synthase component 1 [Bacillus methanolicus]EIJ78685.1 heptaprenyl diphosphate synthase component I [Bacillus methanolicus PB1]